MAAFDTDAWIDELRVRVATVTAPDRLALRIEQRLDDGTAWHVAIADGTVTAGAGGDPDADVTISTSTATAAAIATGTRSAQRAFLDGDLRIGGDVAALLADRDALAAVGRLLGAT